MSNYCRTLETFSGTLLWGHIISAIRPPPLVWIEWCVLALKPRTLRRSTVKAIGTHNKNRSHSYIPVQNSIFPKPPCLSLPTGPVQGWPETLRVIPSYKLPLPIAAVKHVLDRVLATNVFSNWIHLQSSPPSLPKSLGIPSRTLEYLSNGTNIKWDE